MVVTRVLNQAQKILLEIVPSLLQGQKLSFHPHFMHRDLSHR